ncbi:orotidine-5'-phosphate decarboxylase [Desulfovibrio sp. OttesenSCG-928-F07]|nr:orotidine-5'-phosphate decarboxylase [Desulfovibrio sp. OttesenSCG-928-F07]
MPANLVVALDVNNRADAVALARTLIPATPWMKVGLELFTVSGPDIIKELKDMGGKVFLDLKFHDIPNTVAGAVKSAISAGADICDIHACGGKAMCSAAAEAAVGSNCLVLGVTVLTSTAPQDINGSIPEMVVNYALQAQQCGLGGVVCSGHEAAAVKAATGNNFICLCPGIRPAGGQNNDQQRVLTPLQAVQAGANYLVVGRPITRAANPYATAVEIINSYTGA